MSAPILTGAHTLRLLLGDQLNPEHPWFGTVDADVVYVLMEVRQETDYVLHHAQKILAIFAAMRDLARHLRGAGYRVRYVAIDDTSSPMNGGWTSSYAAGAKASRLKPKPWTARIFTPLAATWPSCSKAENNG